MERRIENSPFCVPIQGPDSMPIDSLLIIGVMSRLNRLGRSRIPQSSWLERMLAKKPRMLVAIALANKMARAIWVMMTKQEDYMIPGPTAPAP